MNGPRKLAAILAADVVGFSRLTGLDEEGTLTRFRKLRGDLIDPAISQYRGRIVKTTGDGLLVEFASVVDAVRCAVEVQRGVGLRSVSVPPEQRIEFRIGINVGDVVVEGDDLLGDGVNIAARLEGIADSGGICISDSAYQQVRDKVEVRFTDSGEQILKNIARPVRAYRALLEANGPKSPKQLPLPDKPSIAVMAFDNLSGDPEQDYFSDGVVDDVITALSRFRHLFVISRNSSFTYKGRSVDVKQVGRELGVRYVLEGSLRKSGHRVRIAAQLIDAATGAHLWADRFDGKLEDIFDLQDRITASVVGAIVPRLEDAEVERAQRKPTERLDAYDCFLRGLRGSNEMNRESNQSALALFMKAIDFDPSFAMAYAKAAHCIRMRKINGWMVDREKESAEACRLARRAVDLGRDDAAALAIGGYVLAYVGGELDVGADFIERALTLNPNLAEGWASSGWAQVCLGHPEVALEHVATAMRLSPADPRSYSFHLINGMAHMSAGRYDQAAESAARALHDKPNLLAALRVAAACNALAGQFDEARIAVARISALDPNLRLSNLGNVMPPYRREEDRMRYVEGLRDAGLPE